MALDRADVVPLRITPRTPTETAFWTEKPIDRFRLEAERIGVGATYGDPAVSGSESELHRAAVLIYRYEDGREEKLAMGAELFHRLLRLGSGYQLGDISTDDTFARLSIFLQRLVQENDRELMAWNPDSGRSGPSVARFKCPLRHRQEARNRAGWSRREEILERPHDRWRMCWEGAMTRAVWSNDYRHAVPVSVQDFDLSAVLPTVFYMFRFARRRGNGELCQGVRACLRYSGPAPSLGDG